MEKGREDMKQIAFMILKPLLLKGVDERALRIPVAELVVWEKRTKIRAEQIQVLTELFRARAIQQIDTVLK